MVRILLAEDHGVVRQRLKHLLAQEPGFHLVADTGDGLEAARLAVELAPDVLVTDLAMPGMHGLELARRIRQQAPRTRIVIVSIHADEPYVAKAFRLGVLGYVRKDEAGRHLVPAIRAALAGKQYLGPSLADFSTLPTTGPPDRTDPTPVAALRKRDRSALQLAAQRFSDAEIAIHLKLTAAQVSRLRARLMRELGLRTRGELAALARKEGWIGRESWSASTAR